jgi:hypothetical protein
MSDKPGFLRGFSVVSGMTKEDVLSALNVGVPNG